ncbi:MAG: SPOR domain-containing protein [Magnetococcales bacterium]|nr:SPOR domain-containing protein [Magnetococcales bacterium]
MSLIHQLLRDFEKVRHASGQALGSMGVSGTLKVPAGLGVSPGRQRLLWLAGGMALAAAFAVTPWVWQHHGGGGQAWSASQEVRREAPTVDRDHLRRVAANAFADANPPRIAIPGEESSSDDKFASTFDSDAKATNHNLDTDSGEVGKAFTREGPLSSTHTNGDLARSQEKVSAVPFMVQLGIFSTTDEAIGFQTGLPVKVRNASRIVPVRDFLNRPMYAVRSGPFRSHEEAAAVSGGYSAQGVEGAFVAQAVEEVPLVQMDGKVGKPAEDVLPPVLSAGQPPSSSAGTHEATGEKGQASAHAEAGKPFFLYAIQAGSFREGRLAESLAAKLREKGLFPYILRLRGVDNALWHSVCFGLFTDMDAARRALGQSKGGDLGKAYVLPVESRSFIKFIARRGDGTTISEALEKGDPADVSSAEKGDASKTKAKGKNRGGAKVVDVKPQDVQSQGSDVGSLKTTPERAIPEISVSGKDIPIHPLVAKAEEPAGDKPTEAAADAKVVSKKSYINENDRFAVQVGAFVEDGSARDLVRELRKRGYDPYILELPSGDQAGKMRKTVRIGSFQELRDAEKSLADYRKRERLDGYVVTIDSSRSPGDDVRKADRRRLAKKTAKGTGKEAEGALATAVPTSAGSAHSVIPQSVTSGSETSGSAVSELSGGGALAGLSSASGEGKSGPPKGDHQVLALQEEGTTTKSAAPASPKGETKIDVLEDYNDKSVKIPSGVVESDKSLMEKSALATKPAKVPEAVASVAGATEHPEPGIGTEKPRPFLQKPKPMKDAILKTGQGVSGKGMQSDKFFQEAQRLEQEGDAKGAEDFARRALDLNPANHRAREFLARIMFTSGRSNEAYPLLSDGLAKGFDSGLVKLFARILVQDGKTESALGVLENAQSQGGADDEELMALLAAMYQRNKNHWKAIDLYEKLLAKHTDNAVWWMGLAISLEGVDEKTSALQAYQNAMDNGQLKMNLKNFVGKRIQALSN